MSQGGLELGFASSDAIGVGSSSIGRTATHAFHRQAVQPVQQLARNVLCRLIRLHPGQPPDALHRHLREDRQLLQERLSRLEEDQADDVLRDENVALEDEERVEGVRLVRGRLEEV